MKNLKLILTVVAISFSTHVIKATLDRDKIVVWSDKVKNPVSVRFGWACNPAEFNLYNKEGLPASTFRTGN